jgi:hypothetical protein
MPEMLLDGTEAILQAHTALHAHSYDPHVLIAICCLVAAFIVAGVGSINWR